MTKTTKAGPFPKEIKAKKENRVLKQLSRFGRSLLFPIAMLPLAAILLRVGAALPDTTTFSNVVSTYLQSGGNIIFGNLPIFFAVALAFGLTKDHRGEAAIVGLLGMFLMLIMMSSGADKDNGIGAPAFLAGVDLPNQIYGHFNLGGSTPGFHSVFTSAYNAVLAMNVFNGVLIGVLVSWIYNRFSGIEMPGILGFFSGSRLIPAVTMIFILIGIVLYAVIWPWFGYAIYKFSDVLVTAQGNRWGNAGIMFVYGILNRLLIPFGLHQIPNTLFWFQFGDHMTDSGTIVHGDINWFLSGALKDNHAGTFQAGFFAIFMFGLPALVAGIWKSAIPNQKAKVLGLLGGAAVISFFTGITEPVEYAFLYVAPLLYGMHVILTGIVGLITGLFGIQLGFAFSAGFIDYVLSINRSLDIIHTNYSGIDAVMRNPLWLFPIGGFTAAAYYFGTIFLIKKFDLPTPGRGNNLLQDDTKEVIVTGNSVGVVGSKYEKLAPQFINAMGGVANISEVGNCATRLRVTVMDSGKVDKDQLKKLGAFGVVVLSKTSIQIIMGPTVELYSTAINNKLFTHS